MGEILGALAALFKAVLYLCLSVALLFSAVGCYVAAICLIFLDVVIFAFTLGEVQFLTSRAFARAGNSLLRSMRALSRDFF